MYRIAKERKKEFSLSVHSYSPLWTSECVKKKRKPNFLSTDTTHIKWERETNRTSSHHILTAAEVEERHESVLRRCTARVSVCVTHRRHPTPLWTVRRRMGGLRY